MRCCFPFSDLVRRVFHLPWEWRYERPWERGWRSLTFFPIFAIFLSSQTWHHAYGVNDRFYWNNGRTRMIRRVFVVSTKTRSLGDTFWNLVSIICEVSEFKSKWASLKLYNVVKRAQDGLCSLLKTNSHCVNYALEHNILWGVFFCSNNVQ